MPLIFSDFTVRGIDISKYDMSLDVDKLVGKVQFVIVRIGHGTKTDPLFKEFWSALKGKIFRLAYFYLDYYSNHLEGEAVYGMGDYEWGVRQGQNAADNMVECDTKLVFLDIENGDAKYAPPVSSVWSRVEDIADGFFDAYDYASGITNGIYSSLRMLENYSQRFRHRPLYLAWYNEEMGGVPRTRESVVAAVRAEGWTGPIYFWQYASNGDTGTDGKGDGLEFGLGRPVVDLDVWMGTDAEWELFKKGELQMSDILLDIAPLAQGDPRWKDIQLGTSSSTIGSHGCLITDTTMMCRFFGINLDPAGMNAWLKANGGYQNKNLFYWPVLNKLDQRITFNKRYEYAALDKIDEQLRAGKPAIVNVDMVPSTPALDEHWVLVIGKVAGSYIINDPWYGTQFKFEEKYGAPGTGVRIVCTYNFTGTINPLPEPEPEVVLYRVKVNEGVTRLVIRTAPIVSSTNDTGDRAKYPEEYDIFEEKNGYGRIGVSRWISLEWVTKITPSLEARVEALESRVSALEAAV